MLMANVIFLHFKNNAVKFTRPPICNLSGEERCAKMSLLHSAQQLFLSTLSHPEGRHKQYLPSTGKRMNFGENEKEVVQRKACTLKSSPFPPAFK